MLGGSGWSCWVSYVDEECWYTYFGLGLRLGICSFRWGFLLVVLVLGLLVVFLGCFWGFVVG